MGLNSPVDLSIEHLLFGCDNDCGEWLLKLSTKNPDLNLSKPVDASVILRLEVSVSKRDNCV